MIGTYVMKEFIVCYKPVSVPTQLQLHAMYNFSRCEPMPFCYQGFKGSFGNRGKKGRRGRPGPPGPPAPVGPGGEGSEINVSFL